MALLTPPSTSRDPWEAGGHTRRLERPSRVPLPRHKASIAQRMTRTRAPSREGGQPAALCARIIFLSPVLSQRLAGCQQSRFAEPGQIRPGTKLGCCKASKRPLTAGRPEPPPPPTAVQTRTFLCCLKSHTWLCLMALNSCGKTPDTSI